MPGPQRARALYWLGALQDYEGDRRRAIEFFQEALDEPEVGLALRAQLEAGIADSLFLLREELPRAARHAASAVESSERIGDVATQVAALAIDGLVDAVLGGHRWRETLPHAMSLEDEASSTRLAFTASFAFASTLTWADEFDQARTIFTALRGLADERGEGSALPWILANLSLVEYLSGRWDEALRATEDAIDVSLQTRQEPQRLFALGVRALVGCSRGDEGAGNGAETVLEGAERHGVMIATILAASGLGLLELAQDGHAEAHRILEPVGSRLEAGGVREPGSMRFVADDIEALIGLDRLDEAEARLADLERRAQHLDRASALAAAARCRGLLKAAGGDVDGAIAAFREALDQHARVTDPFDRSRTLLALGSAYRREKRKREARETLEEALTSFGALGARPWVERARSGLARIGGRTSTGGELTPTEQRVAILVAEGLANKEVAAKLFVTVKTVEGNLTRVYAKLGVRSRTELALRFTGPDPRVGTGKP
ncbi:MAG: helix-turn-helix transcriptional regulator [Actinomycetota bacterium]